MICRRDNTAFTLLELLLVVAIVAILAAIVLPSAQPSLYDQLRSTAQIVASDLAYARSLAVSNNSSYKTTFDISGNRCTMVHSGASSSLNTLPTTPFSSPGDSTSQHILDLDDLPHVGVTVHLAAVKTGSTSTTTLEFGPLGQTTASEATTIWLSAGSGDGKKYITLTVNPVTGLVETGEYTATGP